MTVVLGARYDVAALLPQTDDMCLLDAVDDYGIDWISARVAIQPSSAFAEPEHGVPAWVGLEYMAQAAAAFGGIEQRQRGEMPTIGLLMGTREYATDVEHFGYGDALIVRAQLIMRDEQDFAAYDCRIERDGRALATAVLKAYRPRDVRELLEATAHG